MNEYMLHKGDGGHNHRNDTPHSLLELSTLRTPKTPFFYLRCSDSS